MKNNVSFESITDSKLIKMKRDFLENEFMILAWNASVEHNKIYGKKNKNENRNSFRMELKNFAKEMILENYVKLNDMSNKKHIKNITKLQYKAMEFAEKNNVNLKYNVGTAQKFLNLLLKYFWCAGFIPRPPHCPIDSRVLKEYTNINENWTEIIDDKKYMEIIDIISSKVKNNIAIWELDTFKRR